MAIEKTQSQENMAEEPKFTQSEVDEIIKKRLARAKSAPDDYEELKEKARAFDEAQEANKSDLQKANEALAKLKKEVEARDKEDERRKLRSEVSKKTGVPETLLRGDTADDMEAFADEILKWAKKEGLPKSDHAGSFSKANEGGDALASYVAKLVPKNN